MEAWSWILTFFGVLGIYLAGKKNKNGWLIGIGSQILWVSFAIITGQYGFIVAAFIYGSIYLKNYLAWKKEENHDSHLHDDGTSRLG